MTRLSGLIASVLFASCLLATSIAPPATAQVTDRGATPGGTPPAMDTTRTRDDGRDTDWGWIGLLGLAGLGGLVRNRRAEQFGGRTATATR
jgi:hypothetical protein